MSKILWWLVQGVVVSIAFWAIGTGMHVEGVTIIHIATIHGAFWSMGMFLGVIGKLSVEFSPIAWAGWVVLKVIHYQAPPVVQKPHVR